MNEDFYLVFIERYGNDGDVPFLPISLPAFLMVMKEADILLRQDWSTYTIFERYEKEDDTQVHELPSLFERLVENFGDDIYESRTSEPHRRFQLQSDTEKKTLNPKVEAALQFAADDIVDTFDFSRRPEKSRKKVAVDGKKASVSFKRLSKQQVAGCKLPAGVGKKIQSKRRILKVAAALLEGDITTDEYSQKTKPLPTRKDPPNTRVATDKVTPGTIMTGTVNTGNSTILLSPPPAARFGAPTAISPFATTQTSDQTSLGDRIAMYVAEMRALNYHQSMVGMEHRDVLQVIQMQLQMDHPDLNPGQLAFFSNNVLNQLIKNP